MVARSRSFYFSIRCRRNSSVPHPSLARICTGVWLGSSEYHTHTLPLDCSGPEVASAVTSTAGNVPADFDLLALVHRGADHRRFPVADRELVAGAELQRQRLQIIKAGDDVGEHAGKIVFDSLRLARLQILFIEHAFLSRVIEVDRSLAFVRAFFAVLEDRERTERPRIEARFEGSCTGKMTLTAP